MWRKKMTEEEQIKAWSAWAKYHAELRRPIIEEMIKAEKTFWKELKNEIKEEVLEELKKGEK